MEEDDDDNMESNENTGGEDNLTNEIKTIETTADLLPSVNSSSSLSSNTNNKLCFPNGNQYVKPSSISSSCQSVCSSTAGTVGTVGTTRGKRKKDFEDEDDEDTNNCISEYEESINNDLQSMNASSSGFKLGQNLLPGGIEFIGDNLEIASNQNSNQQIQLAKYI